MQCISSSVSTPVVARPQTVTQSAKSVKFGIPALPARQTRKHSVVSSSRKQFRVLAQKSDEANIFIETATKAVMLSMIVPTLVAGTPAFADDLSFSDMLKETPKPAATAASTSATSTAAPAVSGDEEAAKAARKAAAQALRKELEGEKAIAQKSQGTTKAERQAVAAVAKEESKGGGLSLPNPFASKPKAAKGTKAAKAPKEAKKERSATKSENPYTQPLFLGMLVLFSPLLLVAGLQAATLVRVFVSGAQ